MGSDNPEEPQHASDPQRGRLDSEALKKRLIEHLLNADSEDALMKALRGLLTPSELETISTRLEISRLLKTGMTQREVAKTLHVGIATVTRAANEIKAGNL